MLLGCRNGQDFILINETLLPIRGVKIITKTGLSQTPEYVLEPKDSLVITLNMKKEPTSEGHFIMSFNGDSKDFGYFTNGSGVIGLYKITFLENEIQIEEVNNN